MASGGGASWPCVLLVEADPDFRGETVARLSELLPGAWVRSAGSADEAMDLLRDNEVDLVLLGDHLAGGGTAALVDRLRVESSAADPYLILFFDADSDETVSLVMEEVADDCLLKPFRWEELALRVRVALQRVDRTRLLAERARRLEQLYERQCEFLSLVSHEIRTPLSAIMSSANILLRYGQSRPESVERFARVIHQEGQRLTRLINDFLDLAKIEADRVEWEFALVSLQDLFNHVRESFAALAGERSVRLAIVLEDESCRVWADSDKLIQVMLNLLSNAIKHSGDGETVTVRGGRSEAGIVRIEVEDCGPGIPSGLEEKVFERFQQLGSGDERTGTGLGLAISRQIVEHLGGRIWAEKDRSAGALFVVELPAKERAGSDDGAV